MFFIAGTKGEAVEAGNGTFFCPQCEKRLPYIHYQVYQKATIFFVSVANLKMLGEYIECQQCLGTFKTEVLNYNPEHDMQKFKTMYFEGMLKVLVMMMLADGKIDEREKQIMKDVFWEFSGHEVKLKDEEIQVEIDNCIRFPMTMDDYLESLFPYLNDAGKEIIIKGAFYVSMADDVFVEEE